MIVCCIQYTLDPHQLGAFEEYAKRWPPIVERSGGRLLGYFLPKEGTNNFALALVGPSLAAYEDYRAKLASDSEAKENLADAERTRCILVESRSFLRRVSSFSNPKRSWCARPGLPGESTAGITS